MNTFEELMNTRWIIKSKEKEKYYKIKDELPQLKQFITEKLGYRIIANPYTIKLEKMPGEPKAWMGISDFTDPEDYSLLCLVLMFLEDKEIEEQFVLSQLTEYVGGLHQGGMDWTVFANRRKLVRVIKFCLKNSLIIVDEGNEDEFSQSIETEALFENTGLSRYFMRTFGRDIGSYCKPEDFYSEEWVDMDEDRGVVRRQRVYRKLLLSLGVYKSDQNDEDFIYIRNYRNLIEGDFEKLTDCSLQVHKGSAYLIIGEDGELGKVFPGANSISDGILLLNSMIEEQIKGGKLKPKANESINISFVEMKNLADACHERYRENFAKQYREMEKDEFTELLISEMEKLDFIEIDEITGRVEIFPVVGKIVGGYKES